jgi:hypothetical protein
VLEIASRRSARPKRRPVLPLQLTREDHVGFSADTERKLLANSGGFCCNPDCRCSLFPDQGNVIVTVSQMAHIIGKSTKGPRGDSDLSETERDSYENAILLCPTCHATIDNSKLVDKYDEAVLRQWKAAREREIQDAVGLPSFEAVDALLDAVRGLLRENRAIFETVGPGGPHFDDPFSPKANQWRHLMREKIVPNNWRIVALARRNQLLLTEEQLQAIAEFAVHADALAYNCLAERPREGYPRFPKSMSEAFG